MNHKMRDYKHKSGPSFALKNPNERPGGAHEPNALPILQPVLPQRSRPRAPQAGRTSGGVPARGDYRIVHWGVIPAPHLAFPQRSRPRAPQAGRTSGPHPNMRGLLNRTLGRYSSISESSCWNTAPMYEFRSPPAGIMRTCTGYSSRASYIEAIFQHEIL